MSLFGRGQSSGFYSPEYFLKPFAELLESRKVPGLGI